MRNLRRWGPLAGAGILALAVILRAFGLNDLAGFLESVGSILGVPPEFVASLVQVPAALAALTGVGLKLYNMYKAARDEDKFVRGEFR